MIKKAEIGTISHATLRPQDLIPAFLSALHELDASAFNSYFSKLENSPLGRLLHYKTLDWDCEDKQVDAYVESEDCAWDLEALVDALNDLSPAYCYFGAHEGDGSDFGFWPCFDSLEELPTLESGIEHGPQADDYKEVNCHGNLTVFSSTGEMIWDIV